MTDDHLTDIDPIIVEKISEQADVFIDIDTRVNEVIGWGEDELKSKEKDLKASGGTLQDFKNAAMAIETAVADKLRQLETEVKARYPKDSNG